MNTDSNGMGIPRPESANRFAPGTFSNPSAPASTPGMLRAQTRMELSLFLRNGEQLLVALVIPIAILIGLTLLDVGAVPTPRVDHAISAVLTIALMGTAFTGQAISVGFDRRYGALKRLGGTPLPPAVIIGGKMLAVLVLVLGQSLVLGGVAALLGWRPLPAGLLLPESYRVVGPVFARMPGEVPQEVLDLRGTGRPVVYLAVGSSGQRHLVLQLLQALAVQAQHPARRVGHDAGAALHAAEQAHLADHAAGVQCP